MIILVAGMPASGKSYFAAELSSAIRAIHINSDKVRIDMGARGRYSLRAKLAVYKRMAIMTEKILGEGKDVVVDATFYTHPMRDIFLKIARERKSEIRFILVTASEELIKDRLKKPRQESEADFTVYQKIRDGFEAVAIPHLELKSTNDNIKSMIERASQYIRHERK